MASRAIIPMLIVAFAVSGSLAAHGQGTEQQREACTPDVFRLCGKYIPDADRITTCLRESGPRLSPACYVVLYPPQTTSQSGNQPKSIRPPAPGTSMLPAPPADHDDDD